MSYRSLLVAVIAASVSLSTRPAAAQAVTGLGDDATLAAAGKLRLTIQSGWSYYDQRFGAATVGGNNDALQPLGAAFTLDTLGARQLAILRPLQDSLRALSGLAGIAVSLGSTRTQITDRVTMVPITLEAGIARWLSVSVRVPIVHTSSTVFFSANRTGTEGNLGINPALGDQVALAADTGFAQQLLRTAAAVQSYCAGTGAGTNQCSSAPGLVSGATAFGRSVASYYSSGVFVPTRGSDVQRAIDSRAQGYRVSLNTFAGIAGSGIPAISAPGVIGATTPLTTAQVQQTLTDPAFGVQLDPLQTIVRTHIGDVEVAAKALLFDSFRARDGINRFNPHGVNARVAVAAGYRFPTGERSSPDNLTEIGTGTHQSAILARGYADVLLGQHFWTSVIGRYTRQPAGDVVVRYAAPGEVFPLVAARQTVQRQPGNITQIEATPRWVFNDFVSIGGQYMYQHQPEDSYSVAGGVINSATGSPGFDPLGFGVGTQSTAQRIGGGIAFSNAHAVQMGRARFPFAVSYLHSETIRGANTPKLILDQIQVRLYRGVRR
ncbi:MAG: hypothetical protein ACR2MQ_13410 [Gemmatimonadaceae bacterium]